MEARLRAVLKGLTSQPTPQWTVQLQGKRYRIDFAFPDIKLGIEAQGFKWHAGRAQFRYDLRRDRALKSDGWTMLYYAWDDLLRPDSVREEIEAIKISLEHLLF
ncbi:MAG TPA: DUF559 domain-containing protein [Actinomycetota bacterium]|nr:DUF559 domain-containing protein [Actinomycetota bacterium]